MIHKVNICGVDTTNLPKITHTESIELILKIKQGDKQAQDKFIWSNIRLVLSIVQRFSNKGNSDDLFQIGCVGLLKALNNFDVKYNVRFSTYAVPMIIGEIRRYIKESSGIKVSRRLRDTAYQALRMKECFEKQYNKAPTMLEIAEEIQLPISEIVSALDAVSDTISIYEPVFSDGDDTMELLEQLKDSKANEENWSTDIALKDGIIKLGEKEKSVVLLRYYKGKTQMEISDIMKISQAQVSRLEKNAIAFLKNCIV